MTGLNKEIKHREFLKEIDLNLLLRLLEMPSFNEQELHKAVKAKDLELIIKAYEDLENKKDSSLIQVLKEINDFNSDEQMELLIALAEKLELSILDKTTLNLATELYILNPSEFEKLHLTLKEIYSTAYKAFKAEPQELKISEENITSLREDFAEKIHKEAYGKKVMIVSYSLSDRKILTYWLEDYTKNIKQFDTNSTNIVNNPVRPVQEATLIYYPDAGTLQVKAKNDILVQAVRKSFAKVCFNNEELFEDETSSVCVDLERLKTLEELSFDSSKIKSVQLAGMKLKILKGIPFTLELKTKGDVFKQFSYQNVKVKEDKQVKIIKVWIQFKFESSKLRQKTITLSIPNHIGIDNTEAGNLIREAVSSWGLIK